MEKAILETAAATASTNYWGYRELAPHELGLVAGGDDGGDGDWGGDWGDNAGDVPSLGEVTVTASRDAPETGGATGPVSNLLWGASGITGFGAVALGMFPQFRVAAAVYGMLSAIFGTTAAITGGAGS